MLIIKDKPGQLCNRLWSFAPFVSDSLDHGYRVHIMHFYDYIHLFENLDQHQNIHFVKKKWSLDFFKDWVLSKTSKTLTLDEDQLNRIDFSQGRTVIRSWPSSKPDMTQNKAKLVELFSPLKPSKDKVDQWFKKQKADNELIVGVHIRRGDYASFRNGIYFFSDENYGQFMRQFIDLFPNRKVLFLICSNERIEHSAYGDLTIGQIPNGNMIEDLYALSRCDYIMGPPSTYSMWASFYGDTPLRILKSPEATMSKNDFSIIVRQNTFANGTVFSH